MELVKSFIIGHILGQSPWQISAIFSCLVPSVFYCLGLEKQRPVALRDPRKTCQMSFLNVSTFTYRNMRRNDIFFMCVIPARPLLSLSLLQQKRVNIGTFSLSLFLSLCYRSHQVITSFLISSPQTPMALSLHLSLGSVDKNIGRGVREK